MNTWKSHKMIQLHYLHFGILALYLTSQFHFVLYAALIQAYVSSNFRCFRRAASEYKYKKLTEKLLTPNMGKSRTIQKLKQSFCNALECIAQISWHKIKNNNFGKVSCPFLVKFSLIIFHLSGFDSSYRIGTHKKPCLVAVLRSNTTDYIFRCLFDCIF